MSYSRWSDSNWYAFWVSGNPKGKESQTLALYHRGDEKEQRLDWTYAELEGADKQWLDKHYTGLSDTDLSEAIGIITTIRLEVEKRAYDQIEAMVRTNPCPENVDIVLSLFMRSTNLCDSEWSPSSGDLLDLLFSLPSELWEKRLLERLQTASFDLIWNKRDELLLMLERASKFHEQQRLCRLLESWADTLSKKIADNWSPPGLTREEKLLVELVKYKPATPTSMLKEIRAVLAGISADKESNKQ